MPEIKNKEIPDFINVAIAVATISKAYKLNEKEFSAMLELLGCITQEQRDKAVIAFTAFAAKDMMDNKLKY
ncbi:MAG: hypothetical protein K2H89_09810 [Oscillospiraceae bacterium]|nr:hypothetical protein [Oscillospiraceae bacterium]